MKLFIPFNDYPGRGGPMTFMRNLKRFLEARGLSFSDEIQKGDSIFFPISYNLKNLKKVRSNGGKVIQRLDGVYYPSKHGLSHYFKNYKIKKIYQNYADFFIFQSYYSKLQCELMFGKVPKHYEIIHNGVDTSIFYPRPIIDRHKDNPIKLITTGVFRNEDMLVPVVDALDSLSSNYSFVLKVLGPIQNKKIAAKMDRSYIEYLGIVDEQTKIADHLRDSDFFVYSHLNPPCPNSVMEALGCGLAVIGFDSGALKELCPHQCELFAKTPNKTLHDLKDFDPNELTLVFKKVFENEAFYKKLARTHKLDLTLDTMGNRYLEAIQKALN